MIKNERQYRIARAQVEKFERALATLQAQGPRRDVHVRLQQAEVEALRSQLEDLKGQVGEYQALQTGQQTMLEINAFDELPAALVRARIAAGLSQRELAEKIGIKEQQVQRYEATDYASASMRRLLEICDALGVNIRKDLFLPTSFGSPDKLFTRLREMGLTKDFVLKRLVPGPVAEKAKSSVATELDKVTFYATIVASHIFGWTPAAILGSDKLWLNRGVLGAARFKVSAQAEERTLSAYTIYAHFLALQLLEATAHLPSKPIPTDAGTLRRDVIRQHGAVTLNSVLQYVWDRGVPVLPLNDPGTFHGACWRVAGRNVIVLKQKTTSSARWLHDLLHELLHAAEEPDKNERTVIESQDLDDDDSEEELATQFAGDVVLDGRAEELVQLCVEASSGALQRLKTVVPRIAARNGVSVGALANYMAYRLALQGENWWGAATNLQPADENPWRVARDVLLQRVNFSRLTGMDRTLLEQALADPEV